MITVIINRLPTETELREAEGVHGRFGILLIVFDRATAARLGWPEKFGDRWDGREAWAEKNNLQMSCALLWPRVAPDDVTPEEFAQAWADLIREQEPATLSIGSLPPLSQ